jgi:hypothetical protein
MRDWKKKFLRALREAPEFAAEARALQRWNFLKNVLNNFSFVVFS